jgi:CheY-like chemotaxis protein
MPESDLLIDIQEVASTFGKSVESIRKYKNFGIIRVTDKQGNKDLFDRSEVLEIRDRLRQLRLRGLSLAQIAEQLDLARSEDMSAGATGTGSAAPAPDANQPYKILIVDDEADVRASLREYLQSCEYSICEAGSGEEALAMTFTERPHMILLDLRLPGLDGFQVCQTLKGNSITSGIPIIMITALDATPQKVRGMEAGADDYVSKPFDLDELGARIKMVRRRLTSP